MKTTLKKPLLLAFCLSLAGTFGLWLYGQSKISQTQNSLVGSGMITWTPAALGVNALTEPGSGTTAASSIIDTTGGRSITLKFSCTQGNVTVNITTYQEDGATASVVSSPLSAVPANTLTDFYMATEQDEQATSGTISGTAKLRFPQKALSFTFTNANASAGTCTARAFLTY